MGHIIVEGLDDAVIEALQSRAERHGRSVEDEVRDIVTSSISDAPVHRRVLTQAERIALADRIRAMTPPGPRPRSEDMIRKDRDRR